MKRRGLINQTPTGGHSLKKGETMEKLPLEGIRVLAFVGHVAGPMTTKFLADFGAEVILVENRGHLSNHDPGRSPRPDAKDATSLNIGIAFNKYAMNKMSLTLNMSRAEGVALAKKLANASDILIDNMVPYVLERWGLTYDELVKTNPGIIVVKMPTMAITGPRKTYRSTGWNLFAMSGFNYVSGVPGRVPICVSPLSYNDAGCTTFHTLTAVLASLHYRRKTGKGQLIELSQYESSVCSTETFIFEYLANQRMRTPEDGSAEPAVPHRAFRCQGNDRWCAITVYSDREWQALCRTIGREDMAGDERFATLLGRMKHVKEIDQAVEEWTKGRTAEEVMARLQAAGVSAGVVQNVSDLFDRDPQLRERKHWVKVQHPEAGEQVAEDWAFRLSDVPGHRWERAPLLGEHNDYVLSKVLGLSEEQINEYIVAGIVD